MSTAHFGAFLESRLKISNRPDGRKEDDYLAVAYYEQGSALMMNMKYVEAKGFFNKSMQTHESLPGFDRPMLSLPMANLGLAHWLLGHLEEASIVLMTALDDRVKAYGADEIVGFKWV